MTVVVVVVVLRDWHPPSIADADTGPRAARPDRYPGPAATVRNGGTDGGSGGGHQGAAGAASAAVVPGVTRRGVRGVCAGGSSEGPPPGALGGAPVVEVQGHLVPSS